jgi:hypothetical protein
MDTFRPGGLSENAIKAMEKSSRRPQGSLDVGERTLGMRKPYAALVRMDADLVFKVDRCGWFPIGSHPSIQTLLWIKHVFRMSESAPLEPMLVTKLVYDGQVGREDAWDRWPRVGPEEVGAHPAEFIGSNRVLPGVLRSRVLNVGATIDLASTKESVAVPKNCPRQMDVA